MEESYTGGATDDVTSLLDTSSDAESFYSTPFASTPVESFARWSSDGYLRNQHGHYLGGVPQWDTNMGFDQMQRADDQADEAREEQAYILNQGLVNSQKSKETTADSDYDDSFFCDTHSQPPSSWNEMIDPVAPHVGAQFESRDSETHHEAAEPDPIAHSDYQRPSIALSDPVGRTIRPVADEIYCLMLGDDSMTTTSLFEQVREIIYGLNREWMGKLKSTPDLYTRCMPLSTGRLLDTGIRALQQCFSGSLPRSFEDLFALIHVAFAFSIVINPDRDSYYWDAFYSDLHSWHRTVRYSEISLFGKVWDRLWRPRSSNNPLFVNPSRADLYETLMEGLVIKGCANFLDVVAHTAMVKRHRTSTPSPADGDPSIINWLEKNVTQPLTQRDAIRKYGEQIKDAQTKLRRGLICGIHEFELVLISRNTSSKTSSDVHSRYMKEVASQFDLAMKRPGWRNEYHTIYLNQFLKLARESPVYDASKVHHRSPGLDTDWFVGTHATTSSSSPSYLSSDRFVHHNRPITFPSSRYPTMDFYTAPSDISRPNSSSYASPMAESFNPTNSPATSIDLLSTSSAPVTPTTSTSRARSESASSVTLCALCPGKEFTGKPENQKRSLRRHIQTKHSDTPRLVCSKCEATFGRSDNLKRHVEQKNHQ